MLDFAAVSDFRCFDVYQSCLLFAYVFFFFAYVGTTRQQHATLLMRYCQCRFSPLFLQLLWHQRNNNNNIFAFACHHFISLIPAYFHVTPPFFFSILPAAAALYFSPLRYHKIFHLLMPCRYFDAIRLLITMRITAYQ